MNQTRVFQCGSCMLQVKISFVGLDSNERKQIYRVVRCIFADHETDSGHAWLMLIQ